MRVGTFNRLVLVGLVSAGLVTCGAHAGRPTARAIADVTAETNTAHFDTVTVESFGKDEAPVRHEVTGEVDFASDQADAAPTSPPSSTTTTTTSTTVPDDGVASISLTLSEPLETRWRDGVSYVHNAETSGLARPWVALEPAKLEAVAGCLTPADPAVAASFSSGIHTGPSDVVEALRTSGAALEQVGSETVRGVSTVHWRSPDFDPSADTRCPIRADRPTIKRSVDVWTDAKDRARRISSVTATTWDKETFTVSTTTEFFDFGIPVSVVQAPPADQVTDETAWLVALFSGPGTSDAGAWTVGARGEVAGSPWTVYVAPTSTGWRCYDLSDTRRGSADVGMFSGYSKSAPKHDGHATDCVPNAVESPGGGFGQAFDAFVVHDNGQQRSIVGAVPAGANATVEFTDGSSETLTVDPDTWIATWNGPLDRAPRRIHVGAAACRIDGHDALSDLGFANGGTAAFIKALRDGDFPCSGATPSRTPDP